MVKWSAVGEIAYYLKNGAICLWSIAHDKVQLEKFKFSFMFKESIC